MNVLVVDDHPLVHIVMKQVVESAFSGCTVTFAGSLAGAIAAAGADPQPGVALLDLGLPDSSGIDTLVDFRKIQPPIPLVVVLSATDANDTIREAMDAGAAGYLPKTLTPDVMISALRLVASGGMYIPPEVLSQRDGRGQAISRLKSNLTDRQWEILELIADGHDNLSIARQLRISEGTVRQHVHAIYTSLGVSSRTQAVLAIMSAHRRVSTPLSSESP